MFNLNFSCKYELTRYFISLPRNSRNNDQPSSTVASRLWSSSSEPRLLREIVNSSFGAIKIKDY